MRQPGEQGLRADFFFAHQGCFGGIGEGRVVLGDDARGDGSRELVVDLGAEDLAFVDEGAVGDGVIAVEEVGFVGGEVAD